mgnify:CR=1 FL=1
MAAMTMKKTLGDLVKREFSHDYCRETVTLVAQPGGYPMGAILGKDSTTGKFAFSPATAAEPADHPARLRTLRHLRKDTGLLSGIR